MRRVNQRFFSGLCALLLGLAASTGVSARPYGYGGYGPPPPPPGYQRPAWAYGPGYRYHQRVRAAPSPRAEPPDTSGPSEERVTIQAPADGATLSRRQAVVLEYQAELGQRDHHLHVMLDGRRVAMIHNPKGAYNLGHLRPGRHTLTLKVVDRSHRPTGVEASISVQVQ